MIPPANAQPTGEPAFARRELLVVIAAVVILAAVFLPSRIHLKSSTNRAYCVHHLEHIGRSFNLWAADHEHLYPMSYYLGEHGEMEYADETNFPFYFQAMSNQLRMASVLACPADEDRKFTTNFTTGFDHTHISYFIGLDAAQDKPASFLAGDRNISNGTAAKNGILGVTTNQPVRWGEGLHGSHGNVALVDGSVLELNSRQLKQALAATTLATNRLLIP